MNLQAVREEIAARLATIEGLNTFPYRPDKIVPPAAFPDLPERIDYDGSYERGMDAMPLPVKSVEFAIFTIAGVDYLAASFSVDITGNGA
jgi:hypothetical protein